MEQTQSPVPANQQDSSVWKALGFAWELGYMIAIPAVGLGFGGAYLDKYMQMSPVFLILGLLLALGISYLGVRRKIREIVKAENFPKSDSRIPNS